VLQTQYKFGNTEPWWDAHQMTMSEFCNNNKYLPLRFSVYSYTNSGDHPKYGSVVCTLKDIEMEEDGVLTLTNSRGKKTGQIKFNTLKMDMRPSLVQYLRQGWKIDVSVCVDFSLSNLEINDYRSLHKINSNGDMNQYEKALFEVCNVMLPYARNGQFKVYGFGGMPIYTGQQTVSRCWNLNGNADPYVKGTMGVLEAYQKAIHGTKLAGPTYFEEFLSKVKSELIHNVSSKGIDSNRVYSVLVIITDGNCHDMKMTKELLVDMSRMPFSAVVVGVGDSDFADMEVLDADACELEDDEGRKAVRDIVQLVKYTDFKDLGMRELALEVLGEVPDQFVDYMTMVAQSPDELFNPSATPGNKRSDADPLSGAEEANSNEEPFQSIDEDSQNKS
jgi:hypothetical protein